MTTTAIPPQAPQVDPAPVRTPLFVDGGKGRVTVKNSLPWTNYYEFLTKAVQALLRRPVYFSISSDLVITADYAFARLICSGTITLTLPDPVLHPLLVYIFNNDVGVITIAGTINGNPLGYQLVNPYQYVELSSTGTEWLVTANN